MTTSVISGLTDAEVAQRVADGKTNDVPTRAARSVSDIVRANVFTRINAILGVLLVIVLSTGSVIHGRVRAADGADHRPRRSGGDRGHLVGRGSGSGRAPYVVERADVR